MFLNKEVILFVLSAFISFILFNYVFSIYAFKFIALPNKRSSHTIPTPAGAGIVFSFVNMLLSSIYSFWIPFLIFPLALIGFYDDRYGLKSIIRFIIQSIVVIISIFYIVDLSNFSFIISLLITIFLFFLGVSLINFTNFMDGIDGLIASNFLIFSFLAGINIDSSFFSLSGSLIVFLFYNKSPAKYFMGDAGSTFLGCLLFCSLLSSETLLDGVKLILVFTTIYSDAFICVLRRLFNKENIFAPHKKHLYQRLCLAGWSHNKVTCLYSGLTLLMTVLYINSSLSSMFVMSVLIMTLGLYLDKKKAIPFLKID